MFKGCSCSVWLESGLHEILSVLLDCFLRGLIPVLLKSPLLEVEDQFPLHIAHVNSRATDCQSREGYIRNRLAGVLQGCHHLGKSNLDHDSIETEILLCPTNDILRNSWHFSCVLLNSAKKNFPPFCYNKVEESSL